MTLIVSIAIANFARRTLLTKQQDFALLLAENVNHQVYRRFTLPTLLQFGRIALRQEVQYERLDQVVQSTIHGLHVKDLRIYDHERRVSYSLDRSQLGLTELAGGAVDKALEDGRHSFEILSEISPFWAMFSLDMEPDSVVLRTTYPLKVERRLGSSLDEDSEDRRPIMGALEFTQDITTDYENVISFQWLLIGVSCASSLIMFCLLAFIIRRADRMNADRLAEKEAFEAELHQSEKLASMGRTVAGIAHEIRNPLGIIRSSAELLLKRAEKANDPSTRIIAAIHDEAKRLSQTVGDFLDYARPRKPERAEVDLAVVLDQVAGFLESELARRGVRLERRYAPGLMVRGDRDLLYRAFYNVVGNALQAMDGGGEISVRGDAEDGHVRLVFEDTGPGFSPEALQRASDPFFTTKDSGTGLGLPIVANIVKSHDGEISLGNGEAGARVTLRFPGA
ncbi:MAG: two-component sensor histidine kinase [Desulfovibrionaceae bacterium]|nr:two-component sensor histidine kinase [Desulfovibrionaceae bacterium]